jgi:hypothetical protein
MSRVGDIVVNETLSELIARGWQERDAGEAIALRVFMARACTPDLKPDRADHDYQTGAIAGRAYLEQVAPEELER